MLLRAAARAQVISPWRRSSGFAQGLPQAWQKTYEAKNPAEMREAYTEWAPTYDEDSIDTFGYRAPDAASEVLAEYMRRYSFDGQSRILDGNFFQDAVFCGVWRAHRLWLRCVADTNVPSGRGNGARGRKAWASWIQQHRWVGLQLGNDGSGCGEEVLRGPCRGRRQPHVLSQRQFRR
jgi:hypothetical protein